MVSVRSGVVVRVRGGLIVRAREEYNISQTIIPGPVTFRNVHLAPSLPPQLLISLLMW